MIPSEWRTGEVAVLGLGRSGTSASRWLKGRGLSVYVSDIGETAELRSAAAQLSARGVPVDLGGHDLERIRRARAVVVSPGIPPEAPPLAAAREAGVEVLAEVELALRQMPHTAFIVVTGTNGKTTTTALIEHIMRAADMDVMAAGNIGRPLIDLADRNPPLAWCVLEISSFQLHDAPSVAPAVGVLTNLAPDHLNRYKSLGDYYRDKQLLFRNATAASRWIVNADDDASLGMAKDVPGEHRYFSLAGERDAWFDRDAGTLRLRGEALMSRDRVALMGDHNVANVLAAALASREAGVPARVVANAVALFAALPNRLEPVGEAGGVEWINDSKATNVASAAAALDAMPSHFVWLAGGQDKGEPFTPLRAHLGKCRAIVAYGETAPRIAEELAGAAPEIRVAGTLADAFAQALALAAPGDAGILAPACASFDQFDNYEQRGESFRRIVRAG